MQTHCYRDFDAFTNDVRDVDCRMLLQNPKRRSWSVSHVFLPGIHVQLGRLGSGNIVEGQSWSDGYLLYLPLTNTCAYSANGTVVEQGSFMILEPGCKFCVSTKDEHDWCTIFVPTHMLAGGDEPVDPSSGSEKMTCRVRRADRQVVSRFRASVRQIMTAAATCAQFESATAATFAAAELAKVAALIVGGQQAGQP